MDAHLPDQEIENSISRTTRFIEENGAKIHTIDRWGKRRLAYEIQKRQYGYYVNIRFEADGPLIQDLEREFKLDDTILRTLTVLVPKIVLEEERRKSAKAKEGGSDESPPAEASNKEAEEKSSEEPGEADVEKSIESKETDQE